MVGSLRLGPRTLVLVPEALADLAGNRARSCLFLGDHHRVQVRLQGGEEVILEVAAPDFAVSRAGRGLTGERVFREHAMLIAQISDMHIKAHGKLAYGVVDTAVLLRACVTHIVGLGYTT